jgi:hypothetical protein
VVQGSRLGSSAEHAPLAVLGSLVAITVATLVLFLEIKRRGLIASAFRRLRRSGYRTAPKPPGYIRR